MTYSPAKPTQQIAIGSGNLDPFHRLRVSNPIQMIDSKFDHSDQSLQWNQEITAGASVIHDQDRAALVLSVPATGDKVISQTKMYLPYRAGEGHLSLFTFVFGNPTPGVRKRVGLFDDADGIYFEQDDVGGYWIVLRSSVSGSVVEERIARSAWSHWDGSAWVHDGFDGSGPSGVTADPANGQILVIDLQWLGMGLVRTGFDIDGQFYGAHFFRNANNKSSVYMRSATLPVRYEIESLGAAAVGVLEQVCSTVNREGSAAEPSRRGAISRGIDQVDLVNGDGWQAVIGLRLKAAYNKSMLEDFVAAILPTETTSDEYAWQLVLNPTVNATDAALWAAGWADAPSPEAIVQQNIATRASRQGIRFDSATGYVIASGHANSGRSGANVIIDPGETLPLAQLNVAGDSDVLVLMAQTVTSTRLVLGSISFKAIV